MSEIKTDFIEKVICIMKNNEISEVTLEDEDVSLYIKSNGNTFCIKNEQIEEKTKKDTEEVITRDTEKSKKVIPVVSTMIGLFFSKPSPEEMPFVKTGDKVKKGDTLCIIETIKLMNKITAEISGTIKEICIEDGKPVEYGQTIMYIEQD